MSVAEVEQRTDQKAGYSTMCRRGDHAQCATVRAKCQCDCHGSARAFIDARKPNGKAAKSAPPPLPESTPPVRDISRTKKAPGVPVFELVRADPPEPERKKTIAEMVRPLLEEIMVTGETCWYRVVLFPSTNQASFNVARLRNAYSAKEWEFRGAKIAEVDQSAIYARWLGGKAGVL